MMYKCSKGFYWNILFTRLLVCVPVPPVVEDALCADSDSETETNATDQLAQMKIDEWLNFELDREVSFFLCLTQCSLLLCLYSGYCLRAEHFNYSTVQCPDCFPRMSQNFK